MQPTLRHVTLVSFGLQLKKPHSMEIDLCLDNSTFAILLFMCFYFFCTNLSRKSRGVEEEIIMTRFLGMIHEFSLLQPGGLGEGEGLIWWIPLTHLPSTPRLLERSSEMERGRATLAGCRWNGTRDGWILIQPKMISFNNV